ncbi:MAG: hypothetical protein Q4P25_04235 [Tissierellia bacterium]|nr:hypothetical protein [Tissierellia bacterium]
MPSKKIYLQAPTTIKQEFDNVDGEYYPSIKKYATYSFRACMFYKFEADLNMYLRVLNVVLSSPTPFGQHIPDNAYITGIDLYLYIESLPEEQRKTTSILLGLQQGEPNINGDKINEKWQDIYLDTGYIKFPLGIDQMEKPENCRSIIFHQSPHSITARPVMIHQGATTYENMLDALIIYRGFDHPASTRPYAIIHYEYNPPTAPDGLAPENKVLNPRGDIRFTWNSKVLQKSYQLKYQVDDGAEQTITRTTEDKYYILPGDSITQSTGTVYWKVRVKEESGIYSDFKSASFTLGVPEQVAPRIISPAGSYIKNTEPLEFEWAFINDTVEIQKSFTLEYKIGEQDWQKVTKNTSVEKHTVNNISQYGTTTGQWRIKVTNNYDEESPWSEIGRFQIYGVPNTPQIVDISNTNYPIIKWNADDQEMYRVQISDKENHVIYDSGYILDYVQKEHKVTEIIPNGTYTFTVSILNKYGISSKKAELTKPINPEPIAKPPINVFNNKYYLEISTSAEECYIIRNGVNIGKSQGVYKDYTCANGKQYKYQVMIVQDDIVAYSDTLAGKLHFTGNTLALANKPDDFVHLIYNRSMPPDRNFRLDIDAAEIEIEGKTYPIYEFGKLIKKESTYKFYVKIRDLEKLEELILKKEELLLRDYYGKNTYGVVPNLGYRRTKEYFEVTFGITKTRDDYE